MQRWLKPPRVQVKTMWPKKTGVGIRVLVGVTVGKGVKVGKGVGVGVPVISGTIVGLKEAVIKVYTAMTGAGISLDIQYPDNKIRIIKTTQVPTIATKILPGDLFNFPGNPLSILPTATNWYDCTRHSR